MKHTDMARQRTGNIIMVEVRAQKPFAALLAILLGCGSLIVPASAQQSDPIASLLIGKLPVPIKRPAYQSHEIPFAVDGTVIDRTTSASIKATEAVLQPSAEIVALDGGVKIAAASGSFRSGADALSKKDPVTALAIAKGLPKNSLDARLLKWMVALSGQGGIPSGEIAAIAAELSDWPGHKAMRINAERALVSENASPKAIIAAFDGNRPESFDGAVMLAKAYLEVGNKKSANAAIRTIWREDKLSAEQEKKALKLIPSALTRDDHRVRMQMQFYKERSKDALRMASIAGLPNLGKAWAAVNREEKKADALIAAVPAAERLAAPWAYIRAKQARKKDDYVTAAQIMLGAPRDAASLVDPDEWWVERRIVSRGLLDAGNATTAYKLAAAHSAETPSVAAEAEFHAGWYALQFLKNPALAAKHFDALLKTSSTPISQARGHYWAARAKGPIGGAKHLRAAAAHGGTFYGQLSAQLLGSPKLSVSSPRPGAGDRATFASRELVRAIAQLEASGMDWRADLIYRDLADSLNSPGELALLSARAEGKGDRTLALQIGKIAHQRGLEVDTLSWPVGAIPAHAKIGETGKALAYSIARQESAFNISAVSPANARGLLQLLPGTAKLMAKKTGLAYNHSKLTTDPAYNATLGAAYLSQQLDNFDNSYILTFAGYNAGPGRVKQWIEKYGDPRGKPIEQVVDWVERIPFTETRNYVQRVMENYQVYKARLSAARLDIIGDLRIGRR